MYLMVTFSPSANLIVGPGTVPLNVHAFTFFPGAISISTSSVISVICLLELLVIADVPLTNEAEVSSISIVINFASACVGQGCRC